MKKERITRLKSYARKLKKIYEAADNAQTQLSALTKWQEVEEMLEQMEQPSLEDTDNVPKELRELWKLATECQRRRENAINMAV